MPSFKFTNTVAMGTIVANAIAGSQFEFLGRPSRVQIYLTQDPAVGVGEAEVFFGQELEMNQAPVNNAAAAGQGPLTDQDLVVDDIGAAGDRIVIRLQETGGVANAVVRGLVSITPLG